MQSAYFTLFIQIPLKSERNDLIWPSRVGLFFCNKIKNYCLVKCITTTSHTLPCIIAVKDQKLQQPLRNEYKVSFEKCHIEDENTKSSPCPGYADNSRHYYLSNWPRQMQLAAHQWLSTLPLPSREKKVTVTGTEGSDTILPQTTGQLSPMLLQGALPALPGLDGNPDLG